MINIKDNIWKEQKDGQRKVFKDLPIILDWMVLIYSSFKQEDQIVNNSSLYALVKESFNILKR